MECAEANRYQTKAATVLGGNGVGVGRGVLAVAVSPLGDPLVSAAFGDARRRSLRAGVDADDCRE